MDGQVLFEGNIRYHISGMRIAIFLLMALLAGVVMLLTGIAGALDGFILGMLTVFVGLPTAILLLTTASRFSIVKKRRLQIRAREQARLLAMQQQNLMNSPLNPADQFNAAQNMLRQRGARTDISLRGQ